MSFGDKRHSMTRQEEPLMPWQRRRKTAERYGVSVRSIERWEEDPELGFPKSRNVNGRNYDDTDALDAWDAKCAAAAREARSKRKASKQEEATA
jgi:hypothetical protein